MKFTYSVTFEHPTLPIKTSRGTIIASNPGTTARRAFAIAKKEVGRTSWTSVVIVLQKETEDFE